MKNKLINLAVGLFAVALPFGAFANDEALYGAPLPSDAVFLRWIGDVSETSIEVLSYEFSLSDIAGGAYIAISNAALTGAKSGAHYSVISGGDGTLMLIEEPERANKSKVHLTLLNASPKSMRLMLAGTDTEVIGATFSGSADSHAVNPVSATLAVVGEDSTAIGEPLDVTLRRGQNLTFDVIGGVVRVIEDRFGNVIETD